ASMFVIDATLQSGASMQEVERVVAETLSALAARGPSARELTRARALAVTRLTSSLQNVGAFGGVADTLNHYNVFYDDPGKLGWDVARLAAVTPASLQRAVRTWLDTPNRLVLRFRPEASARPTTPAPDRTKPPALGADQLFRPPAVQSARLDNGLEVFVVERHELPLVTAGIVSRAGSVVDPPGKEGLAGWVTSSMGRGTRRLGALALDDAFGALGTALHARTMLEYATQAVEVQRAQLGAALALVAEVTRQPRFAEDELARARRLQREAVEQAVSDPSELRRRLRARFAFGAAHPYGRPTFGFPRTIDGFTRDDAVRLHAAQWTPGGAALIFVGDVTLADARRLAEQTFGSWRGAGPAPIEIPPAAPIARGKVVLVDRPGAAQTVIAHLYDAPRQKAADFYPLLLVSDVLGGNASGRLYANLRQDKGYTYGVGCGLVPAAGPMTWFAQLAVQTDKTAPAVTELRAELSNIAGARPIGANELEAARLGRIRNYAAGFGTHTDVAMQVADLWARRWPMDELVRAPEALMRASLSEVNAAAARYAAPADAALLLIGDRGKIEAPLRALKKVEIVVVDVEGNPVR
ncbi:MAG: pitrilysin family protein, partial [Polyangiales bacterium]